MTRTSGISTGNEVQKLFGLFIIVKFNNKDKFFHYMTWLERPDVDIENIEGRDFANRIRELANRLNIDLKKADKVETREILKGLKSSLSDEIIETREKP